MRLILFILLSPLLALPMVADAIDIANSQYILLPCATDGSRQGEYPDGEGTCTPTPPAPNPDVAISFAGWTVTSSAYSAIEADDETNIFETISKTNDEDPNAYQIVSTECRDGDNRALLYKNDGTIYGPVESNGVRKHRTEITYATPSEGAYHNSGTGLTYDTEFWIGYSIKIPSSSWPTTEVSGTTTVISGQIKTENGPIILRQYQHDGDANGLIQYTARYYWGTTDSAQQLSNFYYRKGTDNNQTSSYKDFPLDQWVDFVIHTKIDNDGTTGYLQIKIIEEDLTETYVINKTGIQIGFVDESALKVNFDEGPYWGADTRPVIYEVYVDSFKFYQGANGESIVKPSGTPCA